MNTAVAYWDGALFTQLNNVWQNVSTPPDTTRLGDVSDQAIVPAYDPSGKLLAQPVTGAPIFQFNLPQLSSLDKSYQVIQKNYWYYTILQSALLALLICLGALQTYGKNFIGTPDDIISLFFFAFSLDLTVDSIAQFRTKPSGT